MLTGGDQKGKKARAAASKAAKAKRQAAAQAKSKSLAQPAVLGSPRQESSEKREGVTRTLENGSVATWKSVNGKLIFRIVKGATTPYLRSIGRSKGAKAIYPSLSPRAAKVAFQKHYRNKNYKSPAARRAAVTRDLCSNNKPVVTDSRYRRSPQHYNYPGLDDGTKCPKGRKVHTKKVLSPSDKTRLLKRLQRGGLVATTPGGQQAGTEQGIKDTIQHVE